MLLWNVLGQILTFYLVGEVESKPPAFAANSCRDASMAEQWKRGILFAATLLCARRDRGQTGRFLRLYNMAGLSRLLRVSGKGELPVCPHLFCPHLFPDRRDVSRDDVKCPSNGKIRKPSRLSPLPCPHSHVPTPMSPLPGRLSLDKVADFCLAAVLCFPYAT
jgi:hypothetical protein